MKIKIQRKKKDERLSTQGTITFHRIYTRFNKNLLRNLIQRELESAITAFGQKSPQKPIDYWVRFTQTHPDEEIECEIEMGTEKGKRLYSVASAASVSLSFKKALANLGKLPGLLEDASKTAA